MVSTSNLKKRRLRRLVKVLVLCVILSSSLGFISSDSLNAYADTAESPYTKDQIEALEFLNMVRVKSGLKPLTLDPHVTQAAIAHAKYYNQNKEEKVSLKAHNEEPGKAGFTGKTPVERIRAAGFTTGNRYGFGFGEVMSFQKKNSTEAMKEWLNTAFHRANILDSSYQKIGIGLVDGTAVVNLVSQYQGPPQPATELNVYPYDGMTDSVVGFYGHEIPNPLVSYGVEYSGTIISVASVEDIASYKAVIKDENDKVVPYFHELNARKTIFLYPKEILRGYHTYKVSVEAVLADSGRILTRNWSFTTGKGRQMESTYALYPELVINNGSSEQLMLQGSYDDGTTQSNPPGLMYSSSKNSGLSVTPEGQVTGKNPGVYTISVRTARGHKTTIKVTVLDKLKTKKYNAVNSSKFVDIQGHEQQASIEWALKSGIMSGYEDNTFKPDRTVSEAEFWIMFLKMLNVHYEAYKPAKATNWAEGAYQIAMSRNIPLSGIQKVSLRNQVMTRQKVADIITAADGKNFFASVQYVLAMDYARGVTSRSIQGFQADKKLTRADAAAMLHYLQPKFKELKGRPQTKTRDEALPEMPVGEYYQKPDKMEDRTMSAEYTADGKLIVQGKYLNTAGETHTLLIQKKDPETGKMKAIEEYEVTVDANGEFSFKSTTSYNEDALVIFLRVKKISTYYSVDVSRGAYNLQSF